MKRLSEFFQAIHWRLKGWWKSADPVKSAEIEPAEPAANAKAVDHYDGNPIGI